MLTDGEHNSGRVSPKEAVALAAEKGVVIYTIGIGKPGEFDAFNTGNMAQWTGKHSDRNLSFFTRYRKQYSRSTCTQEKASST